MRLILILGVLNLLFVSVSLADKLLIGYRLEKVKSLMTYGYDENMVPDLPESSEVQIRLFGSIDRIKKVALTEGYDDCLYLAKNSAKEVKSESPFEAVVTFTAPSGSLIQYATYYFCIQTKDNITWSHQGTSNQLMIHVSHRVLSLPATITIIVFCLLISGLLNGLVVGLMSLDVKELKVLSKAGSDREKNYAQSILIVRSKGNFLLISLVVASTLLNSIVTVLIDTFTDLWITVVLVTVLIVIFCEIVPNATVSRFALTIGARTIYFTYATMIFTCPVSYPLGKFLDCVLGTDSQTYSRQRIKELIKVAADKDPLQKMEMDMISGALEMSAKKVEEVMTVVDDIFSVDVHAVLDYSTIGEILASGYSRIPIYDTHKENIIGLFHVRHLALVDPEDRIPVRTLADVMENGELTYVEEGTTLDIVFTIFKEGVRGHMAFVYTKNPPTPSTYKYCVTGLLTLEDVIEEIIQQEIMDEFDTIIDNRSKRKREYKKLTADFISAIADTFDTKSVFLPINLRNATQSFLEKEIKQFRPDKILPEVLAQLLKTAVFFHLPSRLKNTVIFSEEKCKDCFVMVIEGRAQIVIEPEPVRCECGPFTYFGIASLEDNLEPNLRYNYRVESLAEIRFLRIKRQLYLDAVKASEYRISGKKPTGSETNLALFTATSDADIHSPYHSRLSLPTNTKAKSS